MGNSRLSLLALLGLSAAAGCTMLRGHPTLPDETMWVREQLVIHTDFELRGKQRLVEELAAMRDEMNVKLALPISAEPIHVYLFDKPKRYAAYIAEFYPELPDRRAFFVNGDEGLVVYAHWGERVAEDLRHEVAHGYLHAVTPVLPLWLDEGIAEYFEVPRNSPAGQRRDPIRRQVGMNRAHVDLLSELQDRGQWQPDLARLRRLEDLSQMRQQDYAESWLWLHFLLESTSSRRLAVQRYLAELRGGGPALRFIELLDQPLPQLNESLLHHLGDLRRARAANK